MRFIAIGFATLLGFGGFGCASQDSLKNDGPVMCHGDNCKLKSSQVGQEGATIKLDHGVATFKDWIPKAGSPGKYTGFTIELSGMTKAGYIVNTGPESFYSQEKSWRHHGSNCDGIDDVDFGAGATDEGGGGTGGGCDNPDGCPDQGSGSGGGDGPIL